MKIVSNILNALLLTGVFYGFPTSVGSQDISFEDLQRGDFSMSEVAPVAVPMPAAPKAPVARESKNGTFVYQESGSGGKGMQGTVIAADTRKQFEDAATRAQGNVGSCHAFADMAVLEAAYFRAHGETIRLSEADIFIRRTVNNRSLYRDFCSTGERDLNEGSNNLLNNLQYAQENGVASSVEYAEFEQRYLQYRAAEEKTLKNFQDKGARKYWAQLQQEAGPQQTTERYLAGRDPIIDKERAEIKEKIKDFRIERKTFKTLGLGVHAMSKADRVAAGMEQREFIIAELSAGRPVAVGMNLSNLKAWGQTDPSQSAGHAFVLVGFHAAANGRMVFQTRNSWGGKNPDVNEDELCRISQVVTIKVPGE